MGLRVQTQSAMLRTQRQLAESQGHPPDLATASRPAKKKKGKNDNWPDASDTHLSGNLRPELRSVAEARLVALADMTAIEQQEWDMQTADAALAKLRGLASLHSEEIPTQKIEHGLQYQVLHEQIQRVVMARGDVQRMESTSVEDIVVKEDYFSGSETPDLALRKWQAASPSATEKAFGQLDEYKHYIKAIQKRLVTRFDRLAAKTRQLCETEQMIDTDSFACEVATFTQKKILGSADLSLKSHEGIVPNVALSLIES